MGCGRAVSFFYRQTRCPAPPFCRCDMRRPGPCFGILRGPGRVLAMLKRWGQKLAADIRKTPAYLLGRIEGYADGYDRASIEKMHQFKKFTEALGAQQPDTEDTEQ